MNSSLLGTQRRRSERVLKVFPVVIRGTDLLGQSFEEKTSTVAINLHGCRYFSRYQLQKNSWVTLEVSLESGEHHVRARVVSVQRPHSIRELFQIGVELESPGNIWDLDSQPADWVTTDHQEHHTLSLDTPQSHEKEQDASDRSSGTVIPPPGNPMDNIANTADEISSESLPGFAETLAQSPLLREWSAGLKEHAQRILDEKTAEAVEGIRASAREIEQQCRETESRLESLMHQYEIAETTARTNMTADFSAQQSEMIATLNSASEINAGQMRALMQAFEQGAEAMREENRSAQDSIGRLAQLRLQIEAAEAARATQHSTAVSKEADEAAENAIARWKERLDAEMSLARTQWNELLQSSLDGHMQRLSSQLSVQSKEVLRGTEQKLTERFAELRQPLADISSEARATAADLKSALERDISRARTSLGEIEHSASRMREYSAQLESATHDSLNELHRRLEGILEQQTEEMHRRAERLATEIPERVVPALESAGRQFVERSMEEMESRLAPKFERVSELLHELSAGEMHVEDGLRLHRERLRQLSENNQREVSEQMSGVLAGLQDSFEKARKEALLKWNEELDAGGVRASHAASEAIGRASEWFQQEAHARLQVLVEQTLDAAKTTFDQQTGEATQKFAGDLEVRTSERLGAAQVTLDGMAGEITGRSCAQLSEAAEAAAASFGQVIRGISEQETSLFATGSLRTLQARCQEFDAMAQDATRKMSDATSGSLGRFHAEMSSAFDSRVMEGRAALASEFTSALEGYRAERDAQEKEWSEGLKQTTEAATATYVERLQTTSDTWAMSSVRRLNEHGQDVIESLMRSADQALRESCSMVFEGLSRMLRERTSNAPGRSSFSASAGHENPDTPHASQ